MKALPSFPGSMDNAFIATLFDWDHRTAKGWQAKANRLLRKLGVGLRLTPAPSNMANVEARMNLFHLLEQTVAHGVAGDVVDMGCHAGESTVVMQKIITTRAPEKRVHAFDSFEGLPPVGGSDKRDQVYDVGYMSASLDAFMARFPAVGLPVPIVNKGWFEETVPRCLPDRISFALIDGDPIPRPSTFCPICMNG